MSTKNENLFTEAMKKGEYLNIPTYEVRIPVSKDEKISLFNEDTQIIDEGWASWANKHSRGKKGDRNAYHKIKDNRSLFSKVEKKHFSTGENYRNESLVIETKPIMSPIGQVYREVVLAEFLPVKRWTFTDNQGYPKGLSPYKSIVRLVYIDKTYGYKREVLVDYHGRYDYKLQEDFKVLQKRADLNFTEEVNRYVNDFETWEVNIEETSNWQNAKKFFYGKPVKSGFIGNISLYPRSPEYDFFYRRKENPINKNDSLGLKQGFIDFEDQKDLDRIEEARSWMDSNIDFDSTQDCSQNLEFFDFELEGVDQNEKYEEDYFQHQRRDAEWDDQYLYDWE